MIAVTFALPAESSEFLQLLQNPICGRIGAAEFTCGAIQSERVCVLHTGVGETATRSRIRHFLEHQKPAILISAGFAGALGDLAVGDLLLSENFSNPHLLSDARKVLGAQIHVGRLATAAAVIDSMSERAALAAATGASAVDMETEFIANACQNAGVPLLSLRAISDTPSAPLPAPANVLFDVGRQKTSFTTLASHIARNPGTLWRLAAFAKRIALARRAMTGALATVVQNHSSHPQT